MGRAFRYLMPQTPTHPLPFADDPRGEGLASEEGTSVTPALAKSWIEAFAYVQAATKDIWVSVDPNSARAESLLADPLIAELNYCFGAPLPPHVVQVLAQGSQYQLKRPAEQSGSPPTQNDVGDGDGPESKKGRWARKGSGGTGKG